MLASFYILIPGSAWIDQSGGSECTWDSKTEQVNFCKNLNFDIVLIIEKKRNGAYIHKSKSKGTALLLLFFTSKSQWGPQHGTNAHLTASSRRPLAPV